MCKSDAALSKEYKQARKQLRDMLESLDKDDEFDKEDIKVINSMIDEVSFIIEWLSTGVYPGEHDRTIRFPESGGDSYWDDSINGYVNVHNYVDPFVEIEKRIDKELRMKRHDKHRKDNSKCY